MNAHHIPSRDSACVSAAVITPSHEMWPVFTPLLLALGPVLTVVLFARSLTSAAVAVAIWAPFSPLSPMALWSQDVRDASVTGGSELNRWMHCLRAQTPVRTGTIAGTVGVVAAVAAAVFMVV